MCYYALLICMLLCLLRTYVLYKYCYIISVKSVKDMFAVFLFFIIDFDYQVFDTYDDQMSWNGFQRERER